VFQIKNTATAQWWFFCAHAWATLELQK
jgi:hypothetical protein